MNNILLVEDEDETGKIICMFLESQGFKVFNTQNGNEALKLIEELYVRKIIIDLLITDLILPLTGGLELIDVLQQKNYSMNYMVITAFRNEMTEKRLQDLGCSNILEKPFSPDLLLEKIYCAL